MFTAHPWDGSIPCHIYGAAKLVFVEVPKAGNTSIKRALAHLNGWEYDRDHPDIHKLTGYAYATEGELRGHLEERWREWSTFAMVRHPYDRFRSFWQGAIGRNALAGVGLLDVNVWVQARIDDPFWQDFHAIPQSRIIVDPSLYDHIGRVDDMAATEAWLTEVAGHEVTIPHANRSGSEGIVLDDRTKAIIRELYRADFEMFAFDE